MNKAISDQMFSAFSGGHAILYMLYLALFGGVLLMVAKSIRSKVTDWARRWVESLLYVIERRMRLGLARQFTLKRYCRLRLGDDRNRLLPVPAANSEIKLDVDHAFVPLRLEHASGERKWLDHASLLGIGQRIRIIGDPGSGKSSLVKRLLRDACFAAIKSPDDARFPVLLELRTLVLPPKEADRKKLGEWLWDKVRKEACLLDADKVEACVEAYATGPGLLLLLDGLDEVASVDYPRMHQALLGLSQKMADSSPNNGMVLTMRTQFYKQIKDDFRDDFGYAVTVQPFSPTDIYEFLGRWPFGGDATQNRERRNRIYKELTDRVSLREMCSNPLVLAMYVAQDFGSDAGYLPESRTAFYKQVVEELLIKRAEKRTGTSRVSATVREQRERILGKLAFEHMLDPAQPANSLSWARALAVIQAEMQCDQIQAEAHFKELGRITGLIVEVQNRESFRFIHLTFCEFFAALEASNGQQDGWASLLAHHRSFQSDAFPGATSRLAEVLPFACGLLSRGARPVAMAELATCAEPGVVARTFLESKLYNLPCWADLVTGWKASLLGTPEQDWDEEWLKNLHLFNVVTDDAREHAGVLGGQVCVPDLDAFFKNLLDQQRASLDKLLHAYAKLDAVAVLGLAEKNNLDLVRDYPQVVIQNCDQRPFFAIMLDHAWKNPGEGQAWATLFAEAALRSQVVGDEMAAMQPVKEWRDMAESVPKQASWLGTRLIGNSLLTQCLTIACTPNVPVDDSYALVHVLRRTPAPHAYRMFFHGIWLPMLAVVFIGIIFLGWRYGVEPKNLWLSQRIALCSWAGLAFFSCWKVKEMHTTRVYHKDICGLGDSSWSFWARWSDIFVLKRIKTYGRFATLQVVDLKVCRREILELLFGVVAILLLFRSVHLAIVLTGKDLWWHQLVSYWQVYVVLMSLFLLVFALLVAVEQMEFGSEITKLLSVFGNAYLFFVVMGGFFLMCWNSDLNRGVFSGGLFTFIIFVALALVIGYRALLRLGAFLPFKIYCGIKLAQGILDMRDARESGC